MRMFVLTLVCLALASSAAAQSIFAHFSPLDAAVFAAPIEGRMVMHPPYDAFTRSGHLQFVPIAESYVSPTFLERFQEVRRYGGRLTVPVTLFGSEFTLEGEGARDYGPTARKLDIGRARLTKQFDGGWSAGFEVGAYNLNPKESWLPHQHMDRDYTFGLNWRWSR